MWAARASTPPAAHTAPRRRRRRRHRSRHVGRETGVRGVGGDKTEKKPDRKKSLKTRANRGAVKPPRAIAITGKRVLRGYLQCICGRLAININTIFAEYFRGGRLVEIEALRRLWGGGETIAWRLVTICQYNMLIYIDYNRRTGLGTGWWNVRSMFLRNRFILFERWPGIGWYCL